MWVGSAEMLQLRVTYQRKMDHRFCSGSGVCTPASPGLHAYAKHIIIVILPITRDQNDMESACLQMPVDENLPFDSL
ncbi:unnamed protein product [Allacma fusca]|uniref:Uncharacterized protein n=1 Tax=Allacma fusca TaxID=39272 RepID=A0A8J2J3J8_9HEXA|nr:unnamed protein product [Allacma fusca]